MYADTSIKALRKGLFKWRLLLFKLSGDTKKLREYEHFILILIGLIMVMLDYLNYGSIDDSIGLVFIAIGLVILFGKTIWKNNDY